MREKQWLRLPVVSAGAEYLVMGYLMRWNILTYKAPPNNEGYDLICIHPDPRHQPQDGELAQVRVQGRHVEVAPHYRRPHLMLAWTGTGRSVPRVVPRRGTVVPRNIVEKVPSGWEGKEWS